MVVLKKIKASTLMETLVATVLIVVIFMMSSFILNHLFSNTIQNNTNSIDAYLHELEYLYMNQQISLPYEEDFKEWHIQIQQHDTNIELEAIHTPTRKTIIRSIIEN